MATTVFDLFATLSLDTSAYTKGLNGAKSLASGFGNALAGAARIGITALIGATTAAAGFAATSVKVGENFDKAMSQVAATGGMTMEELEQNIGHVDTVWGEFDGNLREYAQFMGKNTAFSATQAAEALNYMALAGYDAQTSMDMLPNVLNLAAAGNMDLARASDMVTDAQTAFGLSLERTTQMVDEMAKAASTGNTSVEQLGDAFLIVGGLAQELNGGMVTLDDGTEVAVDGLQELEIALTAMANAGVKGSEAGTHMRNMLLKLASPTSDGTMALEELGVAVFDVEGNMRSLEDIFGDLNGALSELSQEKKIQYISDLFNTRDIASAEALLNAVEQDWDAIGASILDAEGAAAQMAETQLDNLAGDVTLFKSALEGLQIAISDSLTPSLREFVQFGTQGLSALTTAFQEGGIEEAVAVFGNILSEGLNNIIEDLPKFVNAGITLIGALGKGFLDNLPMIINSLKTVVTSVITALINAAPQVKQAIIGVLPMLEEIGTEILNTLMTILPELFANTIAYIQQEIPMLVQIITDIVTFLTNPDVLTMIIEVAVQLLMALVNGLIESLPILIEAAPVIIQNLIDAIVENLPMLIMAAVQLIGALTEAILSNLGQLISAGIQILTSVIDGIIKTIPTLLTAGMNLMIELAGAILKSLPDMVKGGASIITSILSGIANTVGSVIEAIIDLGASIFDTIDNFLDTAWDAGVELLTEFADGIANVGANAWQWGTDLIDNFISGIKDSISNVISACQDIAGTIASYLGFSEPDKGPLSNFHTFAPDMVDLFTKGISDNLGELENAASDFALAVRPEFEDADFDSYTMKANTDFATSTTQASRDNNRIISLLEELVNKDTSVVLEGDANGIFNVVRKEQRRFYKSTGYSAFS